MTGDVDWKAVVIRRLRQYRPRQDALIAVKEQIQEIDEAMTKIKSASADGSPVQGGGSGREERLIELLVEKDELTQRKKQLIRELNTINACLGKLCEEDLKIIRTFYIKSVPNAAAVLADQLGIDKSTCYRRRDKAIEQMAVYLYGG